MSDSLLNWDALHKELQHIMKEELAMLREVLSMMREEESSLLQKNLPSKKNLSSKRSSLNKQLKLLQKERSQLTKALTQAANKDFYIHHFNSKNFNLLIAEDEENSVETFHLRDQILHLMKSVRQQKERIATLLKNGSSNSPMSVEMIPIVKPVESLRRTQTIPNDDSSE